MWGDTEEAREWEQNKAWMYEDIFNLKQLFGLEPYTGCSVKTVTTVKVRKSYLEMNVMQNIHPQLVLVAILFDNVLNMRVKVTPLDQI
ncbi:hypothetical protein RF55_18282 [Lasius niger]|uniref:Uncharacterized protein n=1 Tax=Lasius niger TaxID=67767 RepID=A0A0J7K1J6_LASNI|nr:hypothetical protein RF55_18282 [Lasius niger]